VKAKKGTKKAARIRAKRAPRKANGQFKKVTHKRRR